MQTGGKQRQVPDQELESIGASERATRPLGTKWARREKQIRLVVETVLGLVGDFEGINGDDILPELQQSEDSPDIA